MIKKLLLALLFATLTAAAQAQPTAVIAGSTPTIGFTNGQCIASNGTSATAVACGGSSGAATNVANTFTATPQTILTATTTGPSWEAGLTGDTVARMSVGLATNDVPRIAFGPGGATTRDLFLQRANPANLRHGGADAAAPVAQTISVQNVLAGTSNTAGALTTFAGSVSTGTGAGGGFSWTLTPAGSTGTTQNTPVQAVGLSTGLFTVGASSRIAFGLGTNSTGGFGFRNSLTITGNVNSHGQRNDGAVQSDVTTAANYYTAQSSTQATSFAVTSLRYYYATQGTIGAGSTVTNQYGFYAENTLTGATTNYGFYSNLAISGTTRFAFYGGGTAPSHFGGAVDITGTIQTSSPAGSSAGLWKLGALQTAAVTVDLTRSVFIDIGGTVYKLIVAQ